MQHEGLCVISIKSRVSKEVEVSFFILFLDMKKKKMSVQQRKTRYMFAPSFHTLHLSYVRRLHKHVHLPRRNAFFNGAQ